MFAVEGVRDAYVARYRELTSTLLNGGFLGERIDQLTALREAYVSAEDLYEVSIQNADIREYIERRVASVADQLAQLP